MTFEALVATIDQPDDSFLNRIGLRSNVIVCNQNYEKSGYHVYEKDGQRIRWYDFQERGVGLNRNNALHRATADICLLSDDDVLFFDGYEKTILDAFARYPKADVLIFNMETAGGKRKITWKKARRIHFFNCGKFGAEQIAFRRMSVVKNAISFNQLFGGGCMFSAGEDTLFMRACLKNRLRILAVPDCILRLTEQRPSTWYTGHNQKYYEDFGSGYYCQFGNLAYIATFVQLIRRRKQFLGDYRLWEAWRYACNGINRYKNLR